jgi:hypothetical protein
VLIRALAATPGTLLNRKLSSDDWSRSEHLLAIVADRLAVANWQRSKDGQKGTRRPKPISPLAKRGGVRYGKTDKSPEEVKAWLARLRRGEG